MAPRKRQVDSDESGDYEPGPSSTQRRSTRRRAASTPPPEPEAGPSSRPRRSGRTYGTAAAPAPPEWIVLLHPERRERPRGPNNEWAGRDWVVRWEFSSPLKNKFQITENVNDEASAAGWANLSAKATRELLAAREDKLADLISALEDDDEAEQMWSMGFNLIAGFAGDIRLDTLYNYEKKQGPHIQFEHGTMRLNTREFATMETDLSRQDVDALLRDCRDGPSKDSWVNYLNSPLGEQEKQTAFGFVAAMHAAFRNAQQIYTKIPDASTRMRLIEKHIQPYLTLKNNTFRIRTKIVSRWGVPQIEMCINVRKSAQNPSGSIFRFCYMSLPDWVAEGGSPESFDFAQAIWVEAIESFAHEVEQRDDGCEVDDFMAEVERLRPAAHHTDRFKSDFRKPILRTEMEHEIRLALYAATTSGGPRDALSARDPRFEAIFDKLITTQLHLDPHNDQVQVVHDAYGGSILAKGDISVLKYQDWLQARWKGGLRLSIDHLDQITLEKCDGIFITSFHTPNNMVITAPEVNGGKHRYNRSIWGVISALVTLHNTTSMFLTTEHDSFDTIKRATQIIQEVYPAWPLSCIHYERRTHAPNVILEAHNMVEGLSERLGLGFNVDIEQLHETLGFNSPTHPQYLQIMDQLSTVVEQEVARRVEQSGLNDDDDDLTIRIKANHLRDAGLSVARPYWTEESEVSGKLKQDIKRVGRQLVQDAALLEVHFLLNSSGTPSFTLDGHETIEDLGRSFADMERSVAARGADIPALTLYALACCSTLRRVIETRTSGVQVKNVIISSYSIPTVPFVLPKQNKGPFSLSPSRLDHSKAYYPGFSSNKADELTFANFDGDNTFVVDAWVVNAAMRSADAAGVQRALAKVHELATAWRKADSAKGMAWFYETGEAWTDAHQKRFDDLIAWIATLG